MPVILPPETLRKLLDYDPDTGLLHWLERGPEWFDLIPSNRCSKWRAARWNSRHAGKPALDSINSQGYKAGTILLKPMLAHRAAFAVHHGCHPSDQIDHINGDRADNRIANLREASNRTNSMNQKLFSTNTSGVTGVCWSKLERKWKARIGSKDGRVNLGTFDSFDEAVAERKRAERELWYTPRHGT